MDIERQRIQDDLRGIVGGDVLCDRESIQLFASDASIYQLSPVGIVRPRTAADVVATVKYAGEHDLSLHPRGSGSGIAGESLGRGIILDFSRYMRRIELNHDASEITVQSGAILAEVNRMLRPRGRWYGPDPVTRSITTMGSVLATNASGSHYLRSGSARDTIVSMRVVTIDGQLLELSRHRPSDDTAEGKLALGIVEIKKRFQSELDKQPNLPASRGGIRLDDVVDARGQVDLAKFMVGTQGTLGIVLSATLRTESIPTHRGVVLAFFRRLDSAARTSVELNRHGLVACDLMDRRLLQIARETESELADVLPREAEAMLLLELQGESVDELNDRLKVVKDHVTDGPMGAFASVTTVDQNQRDLYWSISRRVMLRLARIPGTDSPLPFTEDLWLPPEQLPTALVAIQETLQKNQSTATFFAHAGHGHLQVLPFLNLGDTADRGRLLDLSQQIAEVVMQHGGQIGALRAAGLSRSYLLREQFGEIWQAMGQAKRLFDPHHRMNPGKLFGAVLQKPNENLRPANQTIEIVSDNRVLLAADKQIVQRAHDAGQSVPQLQVLQHWPPNATVSEVTRACNGCGRCRASDPRERQCPVFRAHPAEEASPRAKANLLRGVLSGALTVDDLAGDRAKAIADLCFNCHQCRVECPASVDIPKIAGELKAQYVATNGLPLSDILLCRIDTLAAIASRVPWFANVLMRSPVARWFGERLFGLSQARELPPIAGTSFMRYAARRRWTKLNPQGGLKVVYFVDHYANYHAPDIGRALAEILQQNSIGLYVPTAQYSSGMPRIASGDLKGARRIARKNVRLLADAVRQGYTVVATEPAAALCLRHEYPNLLDDEDAHLVARNSMEACEYLLSLHEGERLNTEFNPVPLQLAYHQPCHLRVLDPKQAGPRLMDLVPELQIERVEGGCTGMAGTWGLQQKNYRNSLRIGWPMISAMRSARVSMATTECSACKMQIEHGTGFKTLHPLKVLAYAYGRLPKVQEELGIS
ncbi:anaerobic glycerol-3-phosphate dehydrogenase subunit C [Planctomycetes bacterium K23_9]|uniref:Anaerobic glycerol-3-phosphate dehydrogenase subunit C n=1 Tax=Stieleria marina TaxID=1930275 RepID=A0A517NWV9_9BACT|nr:Anaerobic glycerol-3-phosphate dehydrogenase subunit C [Planctomycetes bacterium K23_9]